MTAQRCAKHSWMTITWVEDDGSVYSNQMICRRCAEHVTVTRAGEVATGPRSSS